MSEAGILLGVAMIFYGFYCLGYARGRKAALDEFTLDTYENWARRERETEQKHRRPVS